MRAYAGSASGGCFWPDFHCPSTPLWQGFSACNHPHDSETARVWRAVRSPFKTPIHCLGHACRWEAMDHHMAGCIDCGRVHRCDGDQSDRCDTSSWWSCRPECTEDGSVVCTITGVCIRGCSFEVEYDLLNCQGLAQEDVTESNHSRHGKGYNFDSNFSTSHPRRPPSRAPGANEEGKRKRRKRVPEALGAPLRPSHGAPVEHRSLFVPVSSNMKGDFSEQNILGWCRKLISTIVQDRGKIFSRHMDLCDRRDSILELILSDRRERAPMDRVCLLSVAATLEARLKRHMEGDACMNNVSPCRDPYQCLRVWSKEEVDSLVGRVNPPIYRLMMVLKTIDNSKYKGNNVPWMVLGMLYLCTSGMCIGGVQVLPVVGELAQILPNDNRIMHYFGGFGINTKCVIEMSNMITVTLKGGTDALRFLGGN